MSAGDAGQDRLPVDLAKSAVDPNRPSSVQVPRSIATPAGRSVVTSTQMSLKQVPVSVARGTPVTQSSTTLASRPTIVPASSPVSTTYHVPRGIAAVANISAPRSAVATPIVRATTNLQTAQGAATGFTSGLRGTLVPRVSSPVAQGATWLGNSTVSVTTTVPKCVSPGPMLASTRTTSVTTIQSYTPARTSSMAVTARPLTPQGSRIQTESPRPQLIQKPMAATQTAATQSFFKTNVSSTVARTQTSPITYSGPVTTSGTTLIATQTAGHHLSVGSSTVLATPARLTATQGAAVRPVLATSTRIATTANAAAATRLAAATGNTSNTPSSTGIIASSARLTTLPGSTGALLTTGPTRITSVPVGQGQATRLQAVSASSPVIATPARIAVPVSSVSAQVQQTRLAVSTTSAISPASTRHAVSSTSAISPSPGHQGTTVLATPARLTVTSTLTPGVVSLHPVVVSNTGPSLTLKSPTTHTQPAKPHQNIGPKVITQPAHGPSIQLTQVPVSSVGAAKLPQSLHGMQTAIAISTGNTRTVAYTTTTTVSSSTVANIRPVPTTVGTIPVAKVLPQSPVSEVTLPLLQQQPSSAQQPQSSTPQTATSVYIQTSHRASPAPASTQATAERTTSALPTYTLPTTYYYETGGYQVAGSLVARPYTPGSPYTSTTPVLRPGVHSIVASGQPVRFNPVMVVDPSRTSMPVHSSFVTEGTLVQADGSVHPPASQLQQPQSQTQQQQQQQQQQQTPTKTNASPRPSILRKRDNEGSPMKAQKNLAPVLAALSTTNISPPVSPRRPDSRGNGGNSSGGSTTISATSSPGLGEGGEDSMPAIKQEPADEVEKPPVEMSPRKKPRKQQLTGNELHEPKFSEDEMEFITEERIKKETKEVPEEKVFVPKRPNISLINSYRHTWKSRHNHYLRYSDVKPKDERRPTVSDLANQKQLLQKLNGWKIYHLSTQMEDLSELEMQVFERLSAMLKVMEKKTGKDLDKDINRVNELIKGNMQRSKVIKDQMQEAKAQVMKIFDHKGHVTDIISRCANKRSLKKRDKS